MLYSVFVSDYVKLVDGQLCPVTMAELVAKGKVYATSDLSQASRHISTLAKDVRGTIMTWGTTQGLLAIRVARPEYELLTIPAAGTDPEVRYHKENDPALVKDVTLFDTGECLQFLRELIVYTNEAKIPVVSLLPDVGTNAHSSSRDEFMDGLADDEDDHIPEPYTPNTPIQFIKLHSDMPDGTILPQSSPTVNVAETIDVPDNHIAVFFIRKKFALKGLLSPNCIIHPGWTGSPVIVLIHAGAAPTELRRGDEIGELALIPVGSWLQRS